MAENYVVVHGDLDRGVTRVVGPFEGSTAAAMYCLHRRNVWGFPLETDVERGWADAKVAVVFNERGGVKRVFGPAHKTLAYFGCLMFDLERPDAA